MIAALDTNILLDILLPDERFFSQSKRLLDEYTEKGLIVVTPGAPG
jgi:predicted nucleic-acid-binding protein